MTIDLASTSLANVSHKRREKLYASLLAARRQSNESAFVSVVQWWKAFLHEIVASGLLGGDDRLVLRVGDQLKEVLCWPGIGSPGSIATIINELSLSNDLIPLDRYLSQLSKSTSSRYLLSLLARPLQWSYTQLRSSITGEADSPGSAEEEAIWKSRKGDYVLVGLVSNLASSIRPRLEALHVDEFSRVYTIDSLRQKIISLSLPDVDSLSERDCRILVRHWSQTPSCCVIKGDFVKLTSNSSSSTITKADIDVISLRSALDALSAQIDALVLKIDQERSLAAAAYAAKDRLALVKSHLQRKKNLTAFMEQKIGSRDKMGEILVAIETAAGNEEVMRVLELGATTLRTLTSSPTLGLSHIDATMQELCDSLADAREIDEAISAGGVAGNTTSEEDAEVERELQHLVEQEEKEAQGEKAAEEKVTKEKKDAEEKKRVEEMMDSLLKLDIDPKDVPELTAVELEGDRAAQVGSLEKMMVTE